MKTLFKGVIIVAGIIFALLVLIILGENPNLNKNTDDIVPDMIPHGITMEQYDQVLMADLECREINGSHVKKPTSEQYQLCMSFGGSPENCDGSRTMSCNFLKSEMIKSFREQNNP
ncbi:MAG: hypothetical protein EA442_01670 [Candidatus Nitrosopelagicus sp.]|nr:MAG: hypothetical protein EA442_01670 [Candidatus Nitrosopelagicus sp.]